MKWKIKTETVEIRVEKATELQLTLTPDEAVILCALIGPRNGSEIEAATVNWLKSGYLVEGDTSRLANSIQKWENSSEIYHACREFLKAAIKQ